MIEATLQALCGTAHRGSVKALHILVASRLFAMGATVMNMALGNLIHVHHKRLRFEMALALAEAVKERGGA